MEERNVSVREGGGSMAAFSLIAVIVVVGLIALFVWQPWNSTSASKTTGNSTTTQQTTGTGTTTTGTAGGAAGGSTTTTK